MWPVGAKFLSENAGVSLFLCSFGAQSAARTAKGVRNSPARHPSSCRRVDVSRVHDFLSSSDGLLAALRFARVPQNDANHEPAGAPAIPT
jgi:hypothetical protein